MTNWTPERRLRVHVWIAIPVTLAIVAGMAWVLLRFGPFGLGGTVQVMLSTTLLVLSILVSQYQVLHAAAYDLTRLRMYQQEAGRISFSRFAFRGSVLIILLVLGSAYSLGVFRADVRLWGISGAALAVFATFKMVRYGRLLYFMFGLDTLLH